ncbi:Plasmid stabilization system protein [Candidatus Regiella insecticola 5.15]|uniref:Plasmid stabilization system protein n=1 Tax=Candidatus Regiella insecticola 5.15 TaxID=1005043 RepID=G2H2M7_9ENTR|nr:type II toxin-antitoxin system RelE/ParE family toxin [Candidatus Regiella insecticola]EGY27751.1 Plasmid stabilization system protein [Candidatus Regiella insecticola 5.15]
MALILSPLAVEDIKEIGDYIAQDNPVRAVSFMDELYAQCQQIGEIPTMYPLRTALGKNIRCCPYGRYIILFSIDQCDIRIQRVLHSARDVENMRLL